MNMNGPTQTVTNGANPVLCGAIAIVPVAIKTLAKRSMVHLIWVSREQPARE